MSMILRLADDDLNYFLPFYQQPQLFDLLDWPRQNYSKRLNHLNQALQRQAAAAAHIGKDGGFKATMDVSQFKPEEINVKVVDHDSIVVEGKHEEREDDHGYISRHFVRRYALPQGYDPDKIQSTLSTDGVLTVSIPKPQLADKSSAKERHIEIQQIGPAKPTIKDEDQEKCKK